MTSSFSDKPTQTLPHIPVLREEVLSSLLVRKGYDYVDATMGYGGHSQAIIEVIGSEGRLVGVDQDPDARAFCKARFSEHENVHILAGNFQDLGALLQANQLPLPITGGILADIGVSSAQLDTAERGFSFNQDAPLDMRMDTVSRGQTAADIVNTASAETLVQIFTDYGEERLAKSVAAAIVQHRRHTKIQRTSELAHLVAAVYKQKLGKTRETMRIHPATCVFQALRIAVNNELRCLERFLEQMPALLAPGARVAVIGFHSLEDRLVKQFLNREKKGCICPPGFPVCQCAHQPTLKVLTPKPVVAGKDEIRQNPRARSAKLRVAERL